MAQPKLLFRLGGSDSERVPKESVLGSHWLDLAQMKQHSRQIRQVGIVSVIALLLAIVAIAIASGGGGNVGFVANGFAQFGAEASQSNTTENAAPTPDATNACKDCVTTATYEAKIEELQSLIDEMRGAGLAPTSSSAPLSSTTAATATTTTSASSTTTTTTATSTTTTTATVTTATTTTTPICKSLFENQPAAPTQPNATNDTTKYERKTWIPNGFVGEDNGDADWRNGQYVDAACKLRCGHPWSQDMGDGYANNKGSAGNIRLKQPLIGDFEIRVKATWAGRGGAIVGLKNADVECADHSASCENGQSTTAYGNPGGGISVIPDWHYGTFVQAYGKDCSDVYCDETSPPKLPCSTVDGVYDSSSNVAQCKEQRTYYTHF